MAARHGLLWQADVHGDLRRDEEMQVGFEKVSDECVRIAELLPDAVSDWCVERKYGRERVARLDEGRVSTTVCPCDLQPFYG